VDGADDGIVLPEFTTMRSAASIWIPASGRWVDCWTIETTGAWDWSAAPSRAAAVHVERIVLR
jgi:hypothetical protein